MAAHEPEFGKPPLSRDEMLDAPLLQLRGCKLSLRCHDGCEKPALLSLQWLAVAYGKELQLRRVIARLRCRACHRPPASVSIYDHPTDDAIPTWSVTVMP